MAYRRGGRTIGVLILEAPSLIHARLVAAVKGLDRGAAFSEGHQLTEEYARHIPKAMIGKMLKPAEANRLLDKIERDLKRTRSS